MRNIVGLIFILTSIFTSLSISAKVTLDDVYAADAPKRARDLANNAAHMARHSSPLRANDTSGSNTVVEYSTGPESTSVITKTLKPISGWMCSLNGVSGYYGRGLKGTTADVYQDSGYWKLTSGRPSCGGCAVSAKAICWQK
tara:strand:+ start:489 stop:914 length:426 start_codon:yes stop_codon:yes gene_type:complete